jgi:hypothetical protein
MNAHMPQEPSRTSNPLRPALAGVESGLRDEATRLTLAILRRDRQIADLHRWSDVLLRQLEAANRELEHQARTLESRGRTVERLRAEVQAQGEALAVREAEVARLQQDLVSRDLRTGALLGELNGRLGALLGSTSWRITGPLRRLKTAAQSGRRLLRGLAGPQPARFLRLYAWRLTQGRQLRRAAADGLFDPGFYLWSNPDVAALGMDPLEHYETCGARERRNPHPLFHTSYYLEHNPDVAAADLNPLAHYFAFGAREGRDPHPLFDTARYRALHPAAAASGANPLVHYLAQAKARTADRSVEAPAQIVISPSSSSRKHSSTT